MSWITLRRGERRDAWTAFAVAFGLIGSHAVLETARDALFLSKLPAAELPWVFLATAAVSLLAARVQAAAARRLSGRYVLAVWIAFAAAVTLGFSFVQARLGTAGVYALYVWSGTLTSLVLVQFWVLLAHVFSVTQAKRLYGFIGTGGALGAMIGSGAAGALSERWQADALVLASGCGLFATAALATLFRDAAPATQRAGPTARERHPLRYVAQATYARRVLISLLLATLCLTMADFLFKSVVAERVPTAELGVFLGTTYFALNALSLVCQLLLVGSVLRRLSPPSALGVLPLALGVAASAVALSAGLLPVLAMKAADGALRHSLHRTSAELLFLPFADEARRRIKTFADIAAQRGGQVAASLLILGLVSLQAPRWAVALMLIGLSAAWLTLALRLRAPYVEMFRVRLQGDRVPHLAAFPELDLASLETLMATLDSSRDAEVLAALDVLEREGRVNLVPALILHHPSDRVVARVLTMFRSARRTNVVQVLDRLLDHASEGVRALALATRSVLDADREPLLAQLCKQPSELVRGSILSNLAAAAALDPREAALHVTGVVKTGSVEAKVLLAEALAHHRGTHFADALVALAADAEPEVRRAGLSAMGVLRLDRFIPLLIRALADESTNPHALQVLVGYGERGLEQLAQALSSAAAAPALLWRLPHAMSFFDAEPAARALLAWLAREPDSSLSYQVVKALERVLHKAPTLRLDRRVLLRVIEDTLTRAYRYLDYGSVARQTGLSQPELATAGHELLAALLRDKETLTIERLFRLLGMLHPGDDFLQIHRGLRGSKEARATSTELIERLLSEPLRSAVLGLVDEVGDSERLTRAGKYHASLRLGYTQLLAHLLETEGEIVQDITVYHVGELKLSALNAQIAALPNTDRRRSDIRQVLAALNARQEQTP
ncbi:MAG TPA: hypothetical protein VER33_14370 [Polyangiaceae bacterium]|nr:hypothetical protein [Polyangiaceae bacterium]